MTDHDRELLELDEGDWVRINTSDGRNIEGRVTQCDELVVIYNDPMAYPESNQPTGPITLTWPTLRSSRVQRSLTR